MLSPKVLNQIKQIQLKAGFLTTDSMVGEYSSAFKGLGQEFDKVREYFLGDDIRAIDWNVTARMNEPFVKVYREEREMTLMLMVDVSSSQRFGTTGHLKQEIAAELTAMLAFLAIKNNDKVGLIVFSDHVEQFIPPKKGRAHVWRIIRSVLTHQSKGHQTDLAGSLAYLLQVWKKKSMCFLISDFEASDYQKNLKLVSRKHDLTCVLATDQRENSLPPCGIIQFQDAESGEIISIDSSDPKVRESFAQRSKSEWQQLESFFKKNRIDYFVVDTKQSLVKPLVAYFRKREKRLG
ncbi:MAG: DUF58 domain-containing protein [Oligoflexales bacterium]